MHAATATAHAPLSNPHRLAAAYLALLDEDEPEPVRTARGRNLATLAAVLVLAVLTPMTWMAPASRSPAKSGDQPAATLGTSKAGVAAADDDEDGPD